MVPDFEARLRERSLRVTRPRLAVLDAVHRHPHSDTETITAATRITLPTVSHQAVYDSLHLLTEAGLVRSVKPAGSLVRYEIHTDDNHHHVVCRRCGAIGDVECAVGHRPCLNAADPHGFVIDEAEVVYWGTCADCAGASTSEG